jgi:hypothetical protein
MLEEMISQSERLGERLRPLVAGSSIDRDRSPNLPRAEHVNRLCRAGAIQGTRCPDVERNCC